MEWTDISTKYAWYISNTRTMQHLFFCYTQQVHST